MEARVSIAGWKTYLPSMVLLLALAGLLTWSLNAGVAVRSGLPPLTVIHDVVLVIIGFVAGVLGGLIGTGGCSVMLPAIHFWMGHSAPMAVGTTLFAVIFTALSGGYGHLVRRNLDIRATLWLGLAGIAGVVLGSWLFLFLTAQSQLLGLILGLAFLWPAGRMIWEGFFKPKAHAQEGATISGAGGAFSLFGFVIGVLTGVVGLGGGYALVPGLIYLFGAPVYVTMGTSLATMIPLAVVGGGIKLVQGYVALGAGLFLAMGTIVGAQLGAAIIKRFRPATLKLIFGLYFLYVSVKFITAFFGIMIW